MENALQEATRWSYRSQELDIHSSSANAYELIFVMEFRSWKVAQPHMRAFVGPMSMFFVEFSC